MELVTAPVYIIWSETDPVSTPQVLTINSQIDANAIKFTSCILILRILNGCLQDWET